MVDRGWNECEVGDCVGVMDGVIESEGEGGLGE